MTVVRQPEREMGRRAANLLIERFLGIYRDEPREVVLPAQLVVRRSCGTPQPATAVLYGATGHALVAPVVGIAGMMIKQRKEPWIAS